MGIKESIKKNKFIYPIVHHLNQKRPVIFAITKNAVFVLNKTACQLGFCKKYSKLKSLKNTEKGRCFLVATGPSLTKEDINKLRNEITFGMNSLIKWFPEIGWETTYYGIQDLNTYNRLEKEILSLEKSTILFSLDGQASFRKMRKIKLKKKENAVEYPLCYLNHLYNSGDWNTKFSDKPPEIVYDGYTIAYSLLQIVVFMGFREIYLIGTDCNYNLDKKNIVDIGVENKNSRILGDRMIYAYTVAKKYADAHGIKIFNATRGGMLEVFPRVNLDDIL